MANTLGAIIGVVEHSFSVKNDQDEIVQLAVKIDFTTSTDAEIKSWLAGNRTIAFQRPARALTASELRKLNGSTIMAKTAGAKIQSDVAKIRAAINVLKSVGQIDAANELEAKLEEKLEKESSDDEN